MNIDFNSWPRAREVYHYAISHDLTTEEAIEQLVNAGLSHQDESYV